MFGIEEIDPESTTQQVLSSVRQLYSGNRSATRNSANANHQQRRGLLSASRNSVEADLASEGSVRDIDTNANHRVKVMVHEPLTTIRS